MVIFTQLLAPFGSINMHGKPVQTSPIVVFCAYKHPWLQLPSAAVVAGGQDLDPVCATDLRVPGFLSAAQARLCCAHAVFRHDGHHGVLLLACLDAASIVSIPPQCWTYLACS